MYNKYCTVPAFKYTQDDAEVQIIFQETNPIVRCSNIKFIMNYPTT